MPMSKEFTLDLNSETTTSSALQILINFSEVVRKFKKKFQRLNGSGFNVCVYFFKASSIIDVTIYGEGVSVFLTIIP